MVGTAANVIMGLGAIITGMAGRLFFPDVSMLPGGDPENLYPVLASQHLHPVMFGIVIASIFAAIMSTADSQLLVAASSLVRDIYEKLLCRGKTIDQRRLVFLSRLVVVILVIFSLILGLMAEKLVFWLVLFAWAGLGAAFGPASILALFWKGSSRAGMIAGMISGAATVFIWTRIPALTSLMYELIPGFIVALLVTVIVSKLTKKPGEAEKLYRAMF